MRKLMTSLLAAALLGGAVAACSDSDFDAEMPLPPVVEEEEGGDEPAEGGSYDELYRPLIHFTPARNWMNDPNGMVYVNGVYHLFYQYNPMGNEWGNLSWGHATSTDLVRWKEEKVALSPDELGMIFSGSAVCDKDNTAGFGKDALVALYTSADAHQQQSLAYSTDGVGFTKYAGNPVIANSTEPDFRDPKVFWYEEGKKWIMALAKGWKYEIEFWESGDLKSWSKLSAFSVDVPACNRGQWECPDLIRMEYQGKEKWVLIVSVNPGGPVSGSGTQYFIGEFDGKAFTADSRDYPLWLDYGMDNYAGVTWSNAPDDRKILIGWMNNWNYAGAVPASPWRSAMTLPRELKLVEYAGQPILGSTVVKELEGIAGEWREVSGEDLGVSGPYQLQIELDRTRDAVITLANASGEFLEMFASSATETLITKRAGSTGQVSFHPSFAIPSVRSPFHTDGERVVLDLYVDRSSVEVFTANGSMAQTNLVFPKSIYNRLTINGAGVKCKVRSLDSIWQ